MSCLVATLLFIQPPAQANPIDLTKAKEYFALAERLWDQDDGKLWGVKLQGPLVFVDPATRTAVGSRPDRGGHLKEQDGVYVGKMPREVGLANYSFNWGGEDWVMLVWPTVTGSTPAGRAVLLMHESWHRIQKKIGLPMSDPKNLHLDSTDGRYWLQLEWRALEVAIRNQGPERKKALQDALLFRGVRRQQFPDARVVERQLEMHEGIAEYSGVALSGMSPTERRDYVLEKLNGASANYPTFVRSFAYVSGPAYGLLLDEAAVDWRNGLSPEKDFGTLLINAYKLSDTEATLMRARERAAVFAGVALREKEEQRRRKIDEKLAGYRKTFVDGPVLTLPMVKTQMQFNPNNLQPLDKLGIVYLDVRISAEWGFLKVEQGALIAMEKGTITLAAPNDIQPRPLRGPGWELELKEGWEIVAGTRPGDWQLKKKQ